MKTTMRIFFPLASLTIGLLYGCSHNNNGSSAPVVDSATSIGKVKSITHPLDTETFTYDAQGRQLVDNHTTYGPNGYSVISTFSYSGNTVLLTQRSASGSTGTVTFTLDANGYLSSDNGGGHYTFDADHHFYSGGGVVSTTYVNGNETQIDHGNGVETFTYGSAIDKRDFGTVWINGKRSVNLVASDSQNGGISYTYTFDSNGRVLKSFRHANGYPADTIGSLFTYVN